MNTRATTWSRLLGSLSLSLSLSLAPQARAQQLISDLVVQRTEVFSGDITPTQIAADQNNYNPTSLSTASALRLATDASRTLTGLAGGSDGRKLRLYNVGSFDLVLSNESASSTAANRFALGAAVTLAANRGIELQYDATSSRWRAVGSPAQTAGTGTVTSFSAGDLAPLFTTTEANTTTTPALTFVLTDAAQNTVLAGPGTGIVAGAPAYRALVAADIPSLSATYQPLDSDLTAVAALTTTSLGRGLLTEASAASTRTTLGTVIGTDVQAYDATLAALAGVTTAADKLIYATAADTFVTTDLSVFARTLIDDISASTARTTLGLGTMAVAATSSYSTTTVVNGWFNDPTTNGSFTAGNWRAGLALPGFASADPGLTDLYPFWNDTTNLVNWQSAGATRTALGLGGAAVMSVGTTAGTLAAGDDSRIVGAAQKASNLSDLQSASVSRTNLGLGTMATQNANAVAITGGAISGIAWLFGNTGLKIEDTDASHLSTLSLGSNLTANRTLTLTTGDANRTVTLTGDTSLTGTNTGDQTITLTGGVTGSGVGSFAATVVTNANLTGHVTSTGNAAVLGSFTAAQLNTAVSDGDLQPLDAALTAIAAGSDFVQFTGPATTTKIKTLRDATDTILELGGSYTPTGTWTSLPLASPVLSGTLTGSGTIGGSTIINTSGSITGGAISGTTGTFGALLKVTHGSANFTTSGLQLINTSGNTWLLDAGYQGVHDGYFMLRDQTAGAVRFYISDAGAANFNGNSVTAGAGSFTTLAASSSIQAGTFVDINRSSADPVLYFTRTTTGTFQRNITATSTGFTTDSNLAVTGRVTSTTDGWIGSGAIIDPASGSTDGLSSEAAGRFTVSRDGGEVFAFRRRTSDGTLGLFYRGTTNVGSISVTTTATAYNTNSGEEEKVLAARATSARRAQAAATIDAIPLQDYTWKADGSPGFGPTAQQLQAAVAAVAPAAVSPGDDYDWTVVNARKTRVNARAERNESRRAEHKAAVTAARTDAENLETARKIRVGKKNLRLLAEKEALLNPPAPVEDEAGNLPAAKPLDTVRLANLTIDLASVPTADRTPVVAATIAAPILESDPEDTLPDPKKWGVDYSKLVPLLIAHSQVQKQRIDALETRVTALEAAGPIATTTQALGGVALIALLAFSRRWAA